MIRAMTAVALVIVSSYAATAAAAAPAAATANRIDLAVGGQRVLAAERVTNYSTAVNDVVQIKSTDDGRYLLLRALKEGYTGLVLVYADGTTASYDIHVGRVPPGGGGATRIDLVVGAQKVLPSAAIVHYAVGSDVVTVKSFDDGRKLLVNAVKPGYTGLTLFYVDGRVESYDLHIAR